MRALVKAAGKELHPIYVGGWTPAQGPAGPRASQSLSCAPGTTPDTEVKNRASREHHCPVIIPNVRKEDPGGTPSFSLLAQQRGWVNH